MKKTFKIIISSNQYNINYLIILKNRKLLKFNAITFFFFFFFLIQIVGKIQKFFETEIRDFFSYSYFRINLALELSYFIPSSIMYQDIIAMCTRFCVSQMTDGTALILHYRRQWSALHRIQYFRFTGLRDPPRSWFGRSRAVNRYRSI